MKQSNHTAKDIERYHRGELSAAEMHSLEKAALDDPFLADALEGYSHTKTTSSDLASLQQKLQVRIQRDENKRRALFIDNSWMKVAALFILFAGGGWLVFKTLSDGNKKTELATIPIVQQKAPASPTESRYDTTTQVYSDATVTNQTTLKKANQQKDFSKEDDLTLSTPPKKQAQIVPSTLNSQLTDSSKDKVYAQLETMTSAREKGYDSPANKSEALFKKESKSFATTSGVVTDTIKNFDVVLQPTPMALDEVVVVNKSKTVARQDAKRRMQITVDTLEPAEGWTNFGDYIATNMRSPEELRTKPTKGEVELSFEVNKQGEPVNITVVRSLCEKCDEEAVRLLKEGPKWKKTKKKGKVKFSF